jgi:HAD superfamily hydrolase (TIGR01490 family)
MTVVATRRAAFFDVDETLIAVKSLFRFLGPDGDRTEREFRARAAAGASREELNRAYFRRLAGLDATEAAVLGRRWFEAELRRGRLFNSAVLEALHRHAVAGDPTVLVSGSFPPCVEPIARYVGADAVLCTRPEVRYGRYTGEVAVPMVGEAKVDAVLSWAAANGVELADSHAYGDHVSDLPVLALVGRPVVVGDDPELTRHAARRGWERMP